jgi:GH24 family phage-related lysozyme (muramidase)
METLSKWETRLVKMRQMPYSLMNAVNTFYHSLCKIPFWAEMSDGQRGALLSFAYNLGAGFYGGSNFNTISKRLKEKDWENVPDALFMYRNPGSHVEAGLARRRKAEGELWKS